MALSSLSVVGNANRLRRYRPASLPDAQVAHVEPLIQVGDADDTGAAEQDSAGLHTEDPGGTGDVRPKPPGPAILVGRPFHTQSESEDNRCRRYGKDA